MFQLNMHYIYKLSTHIGWYAEPLSIGQCEHLVVVKDTVEILHPLGVYVSIKNNPLTFVDLSTNIVNDSRERTQF